MSETIATCSRCGIAKAVGEFAVDRSKTRGHKSCCKLCDNEVHRERYAESPERFYTPKPRVRIFTWRTCEVCKESFETHISTKRFCTDSCKWRAKRARQAGLPPKPMTEVQRAVARRRWRQQSAKRREAVGSDPRGSRRWRELRARVLAEESTCWLCQQAIDPAVAYPHRMSGSADHVVPMLLGGAPLDRANVRAAHLGCNRDRGAKLA